MPLIHKGPITAHWTGLQPEHGDPEAGLQGWTGESSTKREETFTLYPQDTKGRPEVVSSIFLFVETLVCFTNLNQTWAS